MINLLPREERKNVRREYLMRLSVVALWLLSGILAAGAAFLLPSFFLLDAKGSALAAEEAVLSRSIDSLSGGSADQQVKSTSDHLALLSARLAEPLPSELVARVLAKRVAGVSLDRIAVAHDQSGALTLSVAGVASTRDTLVSFTQSLKTEASFSGIKLPVSNLAQSESIPFSLSIAVDAAKLQ